MGTEAELMAQCILALRGNLTREDGCPSDMAHPQSGKLIRKQCTQEQWEHRLQSDKAKRSLQ